ncbi:transcriptional regulator [Chryseomicrobium palamuruense]|uniref:Transcriptional regulator n=1 Tax=Chryseomicrobium palamuruense TaxID=682973 RepID=A0ABV8UTY8_9BACL
MRDHMVKAMKYNQVVEIVYMDKAGNVTKRRIRVLKMNGERLWVWDYNKRAKRTFLLDHILASQPVLHKEREIV